MSKELQCGTDGHFEKTADPLTYAQFVDDYRDADLFRRVAEEVGVGYFVTRDPDVGAYLVRDPASKFVEVKLGLSEIVFDTDAKANHAREKVKMGGAVVKLTANPGEDLAEFWKKYRDAEKEQQRAAHQQSGDDLEPR